MINNLLIFHSIKGSLKYTIVRKNIKPVLSIMKIFWQNEYCNLKIKSKVFNNNRNLFLISEHIFLRNSYSNIISKQTSHILYKKHIFDSLTIAPTLKSFWCNKKNKNCIDFGTGGGFPGLVLAIAFPQIFFSMLDSIERKTKFHHGIIFVLNIKNCNSICSRGEYFISSISHRKRYDLVMSRAVAELVDLLELFVSMTNSDGKFIAMKKIKGCGNEFYITYNYSVKLNCKLKSLVKVDKTYLGKVLVIYKKL